MKTSFLLKNTLLFLIFFLSPIAWGGEKNAVDRTPNVVVSVDRIENKNDKKQVYIKLIKTDDNSPLTPADLKEAHTRKVHVMIIDAGLEDYSHVHPTATKEPGIYVFDWFPKKSGHYRLWADLLPLHTEEQEYAMAELTLQPDGKTSINKKTLLQNTVNNLVFTLSFDTPTLQVGQASMGNIRIVDSQGRPVKNLEPLMGAFAHIVGFEEDFKTIVHVHPMGKEPTRPDERGGPEFQFHLEPAKAGFMRIFAQFRINGKEVFVPFGVTIKLAKP